VLNGRKRLITALSALAMAAAVGLVPGSAQAEPDIEDVQARVDRLYHEAEMASERYNDVRLELAELNKDLASIKADERRQDQRLEAVRNQVQDSIVRQYQGENLSAVGQVVVSDDPGAFLARLSTMSSFNDLQSQMFSDYGRELKALDIRHDATARRARQVADLKAQLGEEKATIDKKVDEAESLLDRLKAEQRERMMSSSRSEVRAPAAPVPASGRAAAAVSYAMAQVGDAYVYGAAGPDAFDCSGLTMAAWAQAGVALPHSSSAQYSSGPAVSASALQPGDLVFYYSPISHVGMYIGNGMIVHAANPSTGVQVAGLYSMPFSGAVRPG
jgi:cell wall-associated NlpC family hydrolase